MACQKGIQNLEDVGTASVSMSQPFSQGSSRGCMRLKSLSSALAQLSKPRKQRPNLKIVINIGLFDSMTRPSIAASPGVVFLPP